MKQACGLLVDFFRHQIETRIRCEAQVCFESMELTGGMTNLLDRDLCKLPKHL